MFRLQCCEGSRKCRVFELSKTKDYKNVYMKIGYCSKCKRTITLIERVDFNGRISPIRRYGSEAWELYEKNLHNIVCELVMLSKQSAKVSWIYGKIINGETYVPRYMDESGNAGEKIHSPVKIVKIDEFYNNKSSICKKCS